MKKHSLQYIMSFEPTRNMYAMADLVAVRVHDGRHYVRKHRYDNTFGFVSETEFKEMLSHCHLPFILDEFYVSDFILKHDEGYLPEFRKLEVGSKVSIIDDNGNKIGEGIVCNINDFRESSMKYAVDVVGYTEDVLFFGENQLVLCE